MYIEVEKKLFTTDDFSKMHEAGIIGPDERVELVDGEIIKLNPGKRHVACTMRASRFFIEAFGPRACVSIQNPIVLDLYNEPKPDVVILKPRADFYASTEPAPEHSFFVVEISDTTLAMDRKRKLPKYARLGVPEYWIANAEGRVVSRWRSLDDPGEVFSSRIEWLPAGTETPLVIDLPALFEDALG